MKNKIKIVASRLFQEKGFHNTSMREIAEELEVTKAALYYHYPTKEELFIEIINDAFETMNGFFSSYRPDVPFMGFIHCWIGEIVKQRREYPGLRKLIFYLMMGRYRNQINFDLRPHMEQGVRFFRSVIDHALEKKEIRQDLPVDFLLKFVFTTVQGMLNDLEESPVLNFDEMSDKELVEAIYSLVKGALEPR